MLGASSDLDRQLSPSSTVASLEAYLREYDVRSAAARRELEVQTDLRYGPHADESLDYFPGPDRHAPVHVFVHGGNWQAVTKDASAFPAPAFVGAGVGYVAVNYGLAPAVGLDDMVGMIRRCVRWLLAHADDLGFDRARVQLSGVSAGAHLVAMALTPDASGEPELAAALAGVVLMSGVYDLEPVRRSYINQALRLDDDAARRLSPCRWLPSALPPVVIARGGIETDEYVRQHDLMLAALRDRAARVVDVVDRAKNHFDLTYDLGARGTPLGDAVLGQLGVLTTLESP